MQMRLGVSCSGALCASRAKDWAFLWPATVTDRRYKAEDSDFHALATVTDRRYSAPLSTTSPDIPVLSFVHSYTHIAPDS